MSEGGSATLFERLGGEAGVSVVVEDLYSRILDDPELASFFEGVAVDQVKRHQRELVVTAVGGPTSYSGRTIREAHAGYVIEPRHVDRLYLHLSAALATGGVSATDAAVVDGLVKRLWHAQFWPS